MPISCRDERTFRSRAVRYGEIFYICAVGIGFTYAMLHLHTINPIRVVGRGFLIPTLLVFSLAVPHVMPFALPATIAIFVCLFVGARRQSMKFMLVGYLLAVGWWLYLVHLSLNMPEPD
jgi:hypothetical protein